MSRSNEHGAAIEFVYTHLFERCRHGVLSDDEMHAVEDALLDDPRAGVVLQGTGGVRKIRASVGGRGKRGGARVTYLYVEVREKIYFLLAFSKNVRSDLSPELRRAARAAAEELKRESS